MSLPSGRRARAVGLGLIAALAASTPAAWADPAPSYAALLTGIGQSPSNLEGAAQLDAAQARARQAAVLPNPVLGVDVENIQGSGAYSGFDSAETTVSLSQPLDLWGRRRADIGAARSEVATAGLRRDLTGVDTAGRLALSYAEAEAAQRRMTLAQEGLDLTLADARSALTLVEEGREPMIRARQGESEAAAARANLEEARANRDAAFARLTAVALLPRPVTSIEASLLDQEPVLREAAMGPPLTVQIAESERNTAERQVTVQKARGRPDLTASFGFRSFEGDGSTALTFGVSTPLPLFDRNRGNVDAARADYRAADARLLAARRDAEADRAAALARIKAANTRVWAADEGVSSAEEAYRLARIGFEEGRISQLELRSTRTALLSAREVAIDARLARTRAEIDLARLEGRAPFQGQN